MHTGRGKKGYKDVLAIVDETDIPITIFRPTHVANAYEDAITFANKGGYIDFTSGNETAKTAHLMKDAMSRAPLDRITLSSDSNGSFPKWNDRLEIVGMGIGKMETLYDTVRHLIVHEHVSVSDAISPITKTVATGLLLYPRKGSVACGSDADLVLLNETDYSIDSVIALGKVMMENKVLQAKNYYDYD